jgi:hypothetical protein
LQSALFSAGLAHNHRRPIHHCHQRTRNQADGLQRMFLDIELAVEPLEADIETTGGVLG